MQQQRPTYETLLLKLGAAQQVAARAASLVQVTLPPPPPQTARHRWVALLVHCPHATLMYCFLIDIPVREAR